MLNRLHIQNYAIISELQISFSPGLNVITGETGAGKSIIMGALSLILGERADTTVLLNKQQKCIVEGAFATASDHSLQRLMADLDLDTGDEVIIRREISANGKSRAFVNDTPVNLVQLNQLSALLVDLHQQFDALTLGKNDFQVQVVDTLAGTGDILKEYQKSYTAYHHARKHFDELQTKKQEFMKELDYYQFQYDELNDADFGENEIEQLEEELRLLSNADAIKAALSQAVMQLNEGEQPLIRQLRIIENELQRYSAHHQQLPAVIDRLTSVHIELEDIIHELGSMDSQLSDDPHRLALVTERLSVGYKLLKKHGVKTTADLLEIKNTLAMKLQQILHIDDELNEWQRASEEKLAEAMALSKKITEKRMIQLEPFASRVNEMLAQVGMPNARIRVAFAASESLHWYGADDVEFLFNANVGASKDQAYQPVRKVASGGELSRLMLCIKSLVAASMDMPTLIFDEIDTGISGEAARQVGLILKSLAASRQIISITHQPQVAGKADAHFFIYKHVVNDTITTAVKLLTEEERIVAIAKMLSGEKPTAAAIENAKEMVMN